MPLFYPAPPKLYTPFEMINEKFFNIGTPMDLVRFFNGGNPKYWSYMGEAIKSEATHCFEVITIEDKERMDVFQVKNRLEQKYGMLPGGQWLLVFLLTFCKYSFKNYPNGNISIADSSWIHGKNKYHPDAIWKNSHRAHRQMSWGGMKDCNDSAWLVFSDKNPQPLRYS